MAIEHIEIPEGERHPPFNWVVANTSERLALAVTPDDLDCVALQADTHSVWRLKSVSPPVWAALRVPAFEFSPSSASTDWLVSHNLGRPPNALVIDSAGTELYGAISHPVPGVSTLIQFSAPVLGTAYLT